MGKSYGTDRYQFHHVDIIRSPVDGFQCGKIQWRNIFTQKFSRPPVAFGEHDASDQLDHGDDDDHVDESDDDEGTGHVHQNIVTEVLFRI